jgi:hypothetical protein
MMRPAVAAAVALAAMLAAPIPVALGGTSPGWRIERILRHCVDDGTESVTAVAADDAWAVGAPNFGLGGDRCGADVEHWNGTSWQRVPVPRDLGLGFTTSVDFPIAASSGRDAWIFPGQIVRTRLSAYTYSYALRWTGRRWLRTRLPGRPEIAQATAFGLDDVWAFGGTYAARQSGTYAARYDGHGWRRVHLPGAVLALSVLSARDMWAIGPTGKTAARPLARQSLIAMHWNGISWHTMPVPAPRLSWAGSHLSSAGLAASAADGLWWEYTVSARSPRAPDRIGLLHWQAGHWTAITLPGPVSGIDAVAQDGSGGAWLLADVATDTSDFQYWYHYHGGQWSRQRVLTPRKYGTTMFGMAWIPHTTSIWSVGEADLNYGKGQPRVPAD